jgi:nucleoside-diphosphate-sugar epimerase
MAHLWVCHFCTNYIPMNKILIAGSGLIGTQLSQELAPHHDVAVLSRRDITIEGCDIFNADLDAPSAPDVLDAVLKTFEPDIIVNCAGRYVDERGNYKTYTGALTDSIGRTGTDVGRLVLIGSAMEYSHITHLPVAEDQRRQPSSPYGRAKVAEIDSAIQFGNRHDVEVVVGRSFNVISAGDNMPHKQLLWGLGVQAAQIADGLRPPELRISRLEAERDYSHVTRVAKALAWLAVADGLVHQVYNIGSGRSISNVDFCRVFAKHHPLLADDIKIAPQQPMPERGAASRADISRLSAEYAIDESPETSVEETIARYAVSLGQV